VILCALAPELVLQLDAVIAKNKQHLSAVMPWIRDEPLSIEARTELLVQMRGLFDLGVDFTFGIFDRVTETYIGGTGLHPRIGPDALEIGYWIDADWQGRGLVSEAVCALCHVALDVMGAHRVEIRCAPTNLRSKAVPERLGFRLDGLLRQAGVDGAGVREDKMVWSLLASEYADHPLSKVEKPLLFDARGTRR
jgi:RimJ/RimL family protein N-acetyltransferase